MSGNKCEKFLYGSILVILLIFYLHVAKSIPYTHDDWDWGSDVGLKQWLGATLNSRYAGNFFVVVLTRNSILKTVVMGCTFFLIPLLIASLSNHQSGGWIHRLLLFLSANLFILSMTLDTWHLTYGWVSGFSNYVLSSLFLLCYFALVFSSRSSYRLTKSIILLPLCVFLQLFVENLAIYLLLFAICMLIYTWAKEKRIDLFYLLSLFTFTIGASIMFNNAIYSSLLSSGSALGGIRRTSFAISGDLFSILCSVLDHYVKKINPYLLQYNWSFVFMISLLCAWYMVKSKKSNPRWAKLVILCVMFFYSGYCLMLRLDPTGWTLTGSNDLEKIILTVFTYMFIGVVLLFVFLFVAEQTLKLKLFLYMTSAVAVSLPLMVIKIVDYKCFFHVTIFLALFCITLLSNLVLGHETAVLHTTAIVAPFLTVALCYYGRAYTVIGHTDQIRQAIIAKAVANGEDTITLPTDRYRLFCWARNPQDEWRWVYFKEFYGIPADATVIIQEPPP